MSPQCPFCKQDVQGSAIQCPSCRQFLGIQQPQQKWYFKGTTLVAGFFLLGPFILPLVWRHPGYSHNKKFFLTMIIVLASCVAIAILVRSAIAIRDYYKMMFDLLG